jgi:hypothetical protein
MLDKFKLETDEASAMASANGVDASVELAY